MTQQIANISSDQLEIALDSLITPAIRAIESCSDLYAVTVADALAARAFDVRHKPSRSDTFSDDATTFLITRDIELGVKLKLNHDRTIAMCDKFLLSTAGVDSATYQAIDLNSTHLIAMGSAVMARVPGRLFSARCEVEASMRYFTQLREMIAEKYKRLATSLASSAAKGRVGVNYRVALNQALQGVYTAIDRYSGERGSLASYVNIWINQALLDKTNLQEGAALDIGSSGGLHDNRATFLAQHSTAAVSLDTELLGDIEIEEDENNFTNRYAEHTRALSTIAQLRPVLRFAGESLRYQLTSKERSLLHRRT